MNSNGTSAGCVAAVLRTVRDRLRTLRKHGWRTAASAEVFQVIGSALSMRGAGRAAELSRAQGMAEAEIARARRALAALAAE